MPQRSTERRDQVRPCVVRGTPDTGPHHDEYLQHDRAALWGWGLLGDMPERLDGREDNRNFHLRCGQDVIKPGFQLHGCVSF